MPSFLRQYSLNSSVTDRDRQYDDNLPNYSKNLQESINQFLIPQHHSRIPLKYYDQYNSFASKKFVYFLNEILGIEENEIRFIMEKILLSTNIQLNTNLINKPSTGPILTDLQTNGNLNIGRLNHPAYDAFSGILDEIRIYNRVLSQTEISYLASH